MQCPQCRSDNTQRLKVIYESGTGTISAKSDVYGASGSSVVMTSGTTQSALAGRAAPPRKKGYGWPVVSAAMAFIVPFFVLYNNYHTAANLLFYVFWIAAIWMAIAAFRFNRSQFPQLYQYWLNNWMCMKCGNIYHQE